MYFYSDTVVNVHLPCLVLKQVKQQILSIGIIYPFFA